MGVVIGCSEKKRTDDEIFHREGAKSARKSSSLFLLQEVLVLRALAVQAVSGLLCLSYYGITPP
jgi:hypothetical protein